MSNPPEVNTMFENESKTYALEHNLTTYQMEMMQQVLGLIGLMLNINLYGDDFRAIVPHMIPYTDRMGLVSRMAKEVTGKPS